MAGGFQDMKGQLKGKRKRETGMEKETAGEAEKQKGGGGSLIPSFHLSPAR